MTIKSLLVKIGADVTELKAGLADAQTYIEKHGTTFRNAGIAITAAGAAITGVVGTMVTSYVRAGDSLLEMSQRTGMSTTALSELKYAASLCGTDIDTVELAIRKMSSSLVDAATKGGPAAAAFAQIGLRAKDLINLSPEQQFDKIAKAIAAVENPAIRASVAQDIFGKSGTKLLPIFAGGTAGLDAMKQKAHDLGVVFDAEAAAKADALGDSVTTLKASLAGIGNTVAATLVPIITNLATTISNVIIKVKDWMAAHPELSSAIVKVVTALGLLMTVLGPMLIMLPTLVTSFKMLGLAKMALLGPIGLVAAALAALTIGFLAVKDAKDKAAKAAKRYNEVATNFRAKLQEAATAAGLTSVQFDALTQKYGENYAAMGMAIMRGKEGVALQTALKDVGAEHKTTIDAQKQAILDKTAAEMQGMLVSEEAKKQALAIITIRQSLTSEIQNAILTEYEYQKWALDAAYKERKLAIEMEVTDTKAKHDLLLLATQSHEAQVAKLQKDHRDEELSARIEFCQRIHDQEDQLTLDRIAALEAYKTEKQTLQDKINQMTMNELTYRLWALDQEKIAEIKRIKESKDYNTEEKAFLLKQLEVYFAKKKKQTQDDASGWLAIVNDTKQKITTAMGNFFSNTLTAFREWGGGGENLLKGLGNAFKTMAQDALDALQELVTGMLLAAAKEVIAAQAVSVALAIKSVMMKIPFPLNLVLAGVAMAAVIALFRSIKLGEGGVVTRPTMALIGERGPEAVIPLDRAAGFGMGGAMALRQNNYFYGNISSNLDIDEISRRLAERTMQAVSKGRRGY